jgi:hypothetical protein
LPAPPPRPAACPPYITRWNSFFECPAYYEWSPVTGDYLFRQRKPRGFES